MKICMQINYVVGLVFTVTALIGAGSALAATRGEAMLYLVEFEATESGAPNGHEQTIELLDKTVIPSLEKLATDGNIQAGGLLVGARAGVFIVAAGSHVEVTELVRALPAWGVWDWKVTPLENFAYRADVEKKVVKALRAQQ